MKKEDRELNGSAGGDRKTSGDPQGTDIRKIWAYVAKYGSPSGKNMARYMRKNYG